MAIAHEFEYFKPGTLDEALAILGRFGGKASLLAGGTDLVAWLRDEQVAPAALVDLKGIAGLDRIEVAGDALLLGPLVTFNDLIRSDFVNDRLPLFAETAHVVASTAIRNRATVVGNICSGVPCCDAGPSLLVHEAVVLARGRNGDRRIPIDDWFRAPRATALGADEIVTGIEIPLPTGAHGGCYVKLGRYKGEDLAQASVAILALPGREFRIAFGAVAPTPVRGARIEKLLNGKDPDGEILEAAVGLLPAEISPITDIRAAKEYRLHMVGVMLRRGIETAVSRMERGTPAYGTRVI